VGADFDNEEKSKEAPRMKLAISVLALVLVTSGLSASPTIFGEYVEARTCDVWTGPCFSNSEINNCGEMAVLGWMIRQGNWDGVELNGLGVAVAVRADGTLSTPNEGKVRAVVYLDEKAGEAEQKALLSLARTLAGKYLQNIVDTRRVKIAYDRNGEEALLTVGEVAKVRTRALVACCDMHCGNEEIAYPALSKADHVACAKAVEHFYSGGGLAARWSDPMKRSAMIGEFSL
jgi:hypothetical protein